MSKELQKLSGNKLKKTGKLDLLNLNTSALSASLNDLAIPRLFYQLVIFVIDGSNSMNDKSKNGISKAQEIDKGIKSIAKRLQNSKNSNSFDVSFLAFSTDFKDVFSIKNVNDINLDESFNPLDHIIPEGTKLSDTLTYVKGMIDNYTKLNKSKNCQVLIQILSDGGIGDYTNSLKLINEIKTIQNTTIACQFLESHIEDGQEWYNWDEATGEIDYDSKWTIEDVRKSEKIISDKFKLFATSPALFVTSIDPEEIRKHMIKSISTVSKID